uniref:Uncharacterized protein n=1 Tax=Cacopsylla melanoneura TaxID=428564 RepID=A0A8D8RMF2_9HEMI
MSISFILFHSLYFPLIYSISYYLTYSSLVSFLYLWSFHSYISFSYHYSKIVFVHVRSHSFLLSRSFIHYLPFSHSFSISTQSIIPCWNLFFTLIILVHSHFNNFNTSSL